MQISGYSSAAMLAYRSSGMKQKAGTVKMQDFLRWYRTQAHRQQCDKWVDAMVNRRDMVCRKHWMTY